eukprot:GABV01002361.1.p1 GENE.GABV01002361.1~~GABV01002361.1.p1  ORF type:complete len:146 (+),score=41.76 GABV01002361.1:130-567(+)
MHSCFPRQSRSASPIAAWAFMKLDKFKEAEKDCSQAISLNGGFVKAFVRRGVARRHLGKHAAALVDFQHALAIEPGNALAKREWASLKKEQDAEARVVTEKMKKPTPAAQREAFARAFSGGSQAKKPSKYGTKQTTEENPHCRSP